MENSLRVTRAIVVDDDRGSALALSKLLVHAGCTVNVCTHSEEAVPLALDLDVDLMTLDLSMPGLDGYQVLRLLRSYEHTRRLSSLPVIAVTGKTTHQDRAATIASGFAAHLAKPVLLGSLHLALHIALSLREDLHRNRYSGDLLAIRQRAQDIAACGDSRDQRLVVVGGLSLAFEQRGPHLLEQALIAAHDGQWAQSKDYIDQIRLLAQTIAAIRLSGHCVAMVASLQLGYRAFEHEAASLRAEMDRVVFTLRERVLAD